MLVLTRKTQEKIQIGENITITIVRVKGQAVRVGIEAPQDVRVIRGELAESQSKPQQAPLAAKVRRESAAEMPAKSNCRRVDASTNERMPADAAPQAVGCGEARRRAPGAGLAPLIRRSQRLGPVSLASTTVQ